MALNTDWVPRSAFLLDKLHARGPVGLEGLTCEKYIVVGDGQLRGQESV